ncbi:MAG: right-handed parallel beta-helix repeat-containing protein [Candidatus Zixiibacteriota bacterium]|nr:MAG: right-handed parallel beta-helix repeat-containing protein [candidate division Zixibacteria bacterium]
MAGNTESYKFLSATLAFWLLLPFFCSARTLTIERGSNLQAVIDHASDGDTILIGAKVFSAASTGFVDSLCGNCTESATTANASYGFTIAGKSLHLLGADRQKTILRTNAGYGIFFTDSPNSSISNLTVTGGVRDADGNATDAAIVVRNSRLFIHSVDIVNNEHRIDTVVVGIGGIFGREGAELLIDRCKIINNGWDGIALYRGASAVITDCSIRDGRGAGIGVTWDATCLAYRNSVSGYWKGIGAFGTSWVVAHNNIVTDNLGWGMIATGSAFMDIANNLVHHNGNCGVAPWSTNSRGRIINNIITQNGWRKEWVCPCVGVWNYGDWAKWEFAYNIVWNNKEGNYRDIWDQSDIKGNLSVDPMFVDDTTFVFQAGSPVVDTGHPELSDTDGTRSDIGPYGGPQGRRP